MAKLLKQHRIGVADDPTALQPTLNDCIEASLQHAELLATEMLTGLMHAASPNHPRRIAAFQKGGIKQAVDRLNMQARAVCDTFREELTRLVYEGGGKEQVQAEVLRFEDLKLFEDDQLDQSIEVARAQQEVSTAVDDVLPSLDALISTLLGWRTIQPGLNPLRPEVFVRALQHALATHVPEIQVRETLIAPAAGLLGVQLRKLYRDLADWLSSTGVEPAVPIGGRVNKAGGATGSMVTDSVAKTLLTLDKLRKLLAGDFDSPQQRRPEFLHTVPASMAMLQDIKGGADALMRRLEQRPKPTPAPEPVDMLADTQAPGQPQRIGQQLGEEVVRLMFDNLQQDNRLLPGFKQQLKAIEPAVHQLASADSRFFSDRSHPARQFLDRVTQRSLGFSSENEAGWTRFITSVEEAVRAAAQRSADGESFGELLDQLHALWTDDDQRLRHRREEAARALLHAEQRNLLARKLASEFANSLQQLEVADFVRDFLRGPWSQVVAEAQLSCADGEADPHGYRALVDDLVWSVQKTTAQRGRMRRLVEMVPSLVARLREGLGRIGYPADATQRFFDNLAVLHRDAMEDGRDVHAHAAADNAWAEPSRFSEEAPREAEVWLDRKEAEDSGFIDEGQAYTPEQVASAQAAQQELDEEARDQAWTDARERARAEALAQIKARALAEAEAELQAQLRAEQEAQAAAEAEALAQIQAAEELARAQVEAQARAQAMADAQRAQAERVRQLREEAMRRIEAERAASLARQQAHAAAAAAAAAAAVPEPPAAAPAEGESPDAEADTQPSAPPPHTAAPLRSDELRIGSWVELMINGQWLRAQLTWSSPHGTLFMFTSQKGTAHSMSRRTLDKLRAQGFIRVVAERNVIDEALDQVAQAALKNSLGNKGE